MSQLVGVFANVVYDALAADVLALPHRNIVIRLPVLQPLQDSLVLLCDFHELALAGLPVQRLLNWGQLTHCAAHLGSSPILTVEGLFAVLVRRRHKVLLLDGGPR